MLKIKPNYREKVSAMISWGHWFTLFNILFALLIGSRYLSINDWPNTLAGRLYSMVSWLGHFSFLCFIVYLLVIFPLTFIIGSQRLLRIIYSIIATVGLTLLLIDTAIFEQFKLHLTGWVWQLIIYPEQNNLNRQWQLLFIIAPIIFLIEMLLATWCWKKLRSLQRRHIAKPIVILFVTAFLTTHIAYIWADANFYRPITMQRNNFPLSYPMTARRFLEQHGLLDAQRYQQRLIEQGNPAALNIEYPLNSLKFSSHPVKCNLLFIVVDQLPNQLTQLPQLAAFAANNISFPQHYSSGLTAEESLLGLFYGLSANYLDSILINRKPSVLISVLTSRHYQFGLFSNQGFNLPLYRQALLTDFSLPTGTNSQLAEQNLVQRWQAWLSQLSTATPWFSYLAFDNSQLSLTEIDSQIGQLLNQLQQQRLLDNTVIIITANHNANQQAQPVTEKLHVPLLIHWPGQTLTAPQKLTEHQDLIATLMQNLLGVSNPTADYSQGENLFMPERNTPWLLTSQEQQLIAISPQKTFVIQQNGRYQTFYPNGEVMPTQATSLLQLLSIMTHERRFVANVD